MDTRVFLEFYWKSISTGIYFYYLKVTNVLLEKKTLQFNALSFVSTLFYSHFFLVVRIIFNGANFLCLFRQNSVSRSPIKSTYIE